MSQCVQYSVNVKVNTGNNWLGVSEARLVFIEEFK